MNPSPSARVWASKLQISLRYAETPDAAIVRAAYKGTEYTGCAPFSTARRDQTGSDSAFHAAEIDVLRAIEAQVTKEIKR